jgi:hypothetical protein
MDEMKEVLIQTTLELSSKYPATSAAALPCTVKVGLSDRFYDHLGDVRAEVMLPRDVPYAQCWLAEDASVGDVSVESVRGQSPEYVNWLNRNFTQSDLEITVDANNVKWAARFPDGREFVAKSSFLALSEYFSRPTLADALRAVGVVSGYPLDGKVRDLHKTDANFAKAFDVLRPHDQLTDWSNGKVRYVLDLAKETDERFSLSKRDAAFAVMRHFGFESPLVATYNADPRFAAAVKTVVPTFETSHWHVEDTVEKFVLYIDRKSAPALPHSGLSM